MGQIKYDYEINGFGLCKTNTRYAAKDDLYLYLRKNILLLHAVFCLSENCLVKQYCMIESKLGQKHT